MTVRDPYAELVPWPVHWVAPAAITRVKRARNGCAAAAVLLLVGATMYFGAVGPPALAHRVSRLRRRLARIPVRDRRLCGQRPRHRIPAQASAARGHLRAAARRGGRGRRAGDGGATRPHLHQDPRTARMGPDA